MFDISKLGHKLLKDEKMKTAIIGTGHSYWEIISQRSTQQTLISAGTVAQ